MTIRHRGGKSQRTGGERFDTMPIGSIAALAVLLAAGGICGLMSFG